MNIKTQQESLICNKCEALRECELSYGPYEFKGETVEDVYRAVCLTCGQVVAVHARSTYRLAEVTRRQAQKRTSISIPAEMQDLIAKALIDAGSDWSYCELYFRALLVACHDDPAEVGRILPSVKNDLLLQPSRTKMNFSLGTKLSGTLGTLSASSGISNTSEIIRRLVILTDSVLKEPFERELKSLALAYS